MTVRERVGSALGTAIAGLDTVQAIVVGPAAESIDFVIETVAGTTVTLWDPAGRTIATATVDDGGVVDVRALSDGPGSYIIVIHNATGSDARRRQPLTPRGAPRAKPGRVHERGPLASSQSGPRADTAAGASVSSWVGAIPR